MILTLIWGQHHTSKQGEIFIAQGWALTITHLENQILREEREFLGLVYERDWITLKDAAGSDSP